MFWLKIFFELVSKICLMFLHKLQRLKLDSRFRSLNLEKQWPPIPLPSCNSNQLPSSDITSYVKEYRSLHETVFPFVSRTAALGPSSLTLDFGCGFGTLASAFASCQGKFGEYVGIDSNPRAIEYCRSAYFGNNAFQFGDLERSAATNYVTNWSVMSAKQRYRRRKPCAPTIDELVNLVGARMLDCQFSLSVFTHMWPEDSQETLEVFGSFSTRSTRFINSWLILDDFASHQVLNGKADRFLPIGIGGIRTYSELNPLVCTAYPIRLLEEVYLNSGHRILDIHYGSWAGRDNGVTYQDLVVSERI